tara:strand:+ start:745 stop:897 length:153 start_codon:yes stop_codon:yes gene_type:complete
MVLVPLQLIKEILVVLLMRHLEAQMGLVGEVVVVPAQEENAPIHLEFQEE